MFVKPFLAAVCLFTGLTHAAETVPLRVLSFNLRYINPGDTGNRTWIARRDQVAALIAKDQSDIIGIQEGLRPMMDDLGARTPGYAQIGCGREDGLAQGEYAAILVKTDRFTIQESGTFWLSDTPDVVNSKSWGNTVVRICTWAKLYDRINQKAFHFYNTHLDHEAPLARQKGIELILSRMAATGTGGPFILTGDLNADPGEPFHALIKAEPNRLVDVWEKLHPDATPEQSVTYHAFKPGNFGSRIDFIYASPSLGLVDAEILTDHIDGNYPSDHYPVRATLTLPAE